MTELERLQKENELLKAQIELYKQILELQCKMKQPDYVPMPYPVYPPYRIDCPTITWGTGTAVAPKFRYETWC